MTSMKVAALALACVATIAAGCGGAPTAPRVAQDAAPPGHTAPIAPTAAPSPPVERAPLTFPEVLSSELPSGLRLVTAQRAQPLVDLRLVVGSGSADDGERRGAAAATARYVVDLARAASDPRVADVDVEVHVDHVVLRASVLADGVEPTLQALGAAMSAPKIGLADARRVAKELGAIEHAWPLTLEGAGERLVRRDLFLEPTARHPFSVAYPSVEDLGKLDAAAMNDCVKRSYVASNLALILVGPLDSLDLPAMTERALAHVATSRAPRLSVDEPMARPRDRKVVLVDAPTKRSASITVGHLAPALAEGESIATQLFGRVLARRIVTRARDARADFRLVQHQDGPGLALLDVEIAPARAQAAIEALFDPSLGREVGAEELTDARGAELDALAVHLDQPGYVADALAESAALGLAPGGWERETVEAETTSADVVNASGRRLLAGDEVIVVVGDAKILGPVLAAFDEVDVVDPAHDFERERTLPRRAEPKLPSAPKAGDD